jgi:sodium/hydrogen exchanger 8
VIGIICFYAAKLGMIQNIDKENPMEALIFGALISAVDPVATLSIMGNDDLNVDPLLYSLVFGESVLNDAIAISLFKTFSKYYNPEGPNWSESEIPSALLTFFVTTSLSILVGVALGLVASWIYKNTDLHYFPKLETSLLLSFCYLCYATAEAVELSGIMALFFQGVVLRHYNSHNLSETAHVASEEIFSTFATLTETMVFIYMGMGVFTGRFSNWDIRFSILALFACLVGRFLNIVPLSALANYWRKGRHVISGQTQVVLWFAGLRGAIAFALAENMPGEHKEVYSTTTLSICIFTTVVCGGFTERMLSTFGMREDSAPTLSNPNPTEGDTKMTRLSYIPPTPKQRETLVDRQRRRVQEGIKGLWNRFDNNVLKHHFGGAVNSSLSLHSSINGEHEMGVIRDDSEGSAYEYSENGEEEAFFQ